MVQRILGLAVALEPMTRFKGDCDRHVTGSPVRMPSESQKVRPDSKGIAIARGPWTDDRGRIGPARPRSAISRHRSHWGAADPNEKGLRLLEIPRGDDHLAMLEQTTRAKGDCDSFVSFAVSSQVRAGIGIDDPIQRGCPSRGSGRTNKLGMGLC